MNLCYVATTRAEDILYMIAEKGYSNTWLSGQIQGVLENSFLENRNENTWTFGEREKYTTKPSQEAVSVISPDFIQKNRLKLRISKLRDDFSEELLQGNIIHETLAETTNTNELDKIIQRVSALKNLDDTQQEQLKDDISKIVHHPQFSKWFSKDAEIIAEREICTADGKVIRPDRVVVFNDHIDVVDFKTGLPNKKHEAQLREYIHQLKLIYNMPVNGYLLYTQNLELIEIGND